MSSPSLAAVETPWRPCRRGWPSPHSFPHRRSSPVRTSGTRPRITTAGRGAISTIRLAPMHPPVAAGQRPPPTAQTATLATATWPWAAARVRRVRLAPSIRAETSSSGTRRPCSVATWRMGSSAADPSSMAHRAWPPRRGDSPASRKPKTVAWASVSRASRVDMSSLLEQVTREILAHYGGVILGTWGVLVKNADASR